MIVAVVGLVALTGAGVGTALSVGGTTPPRAASTTDVRGRSTPPTSSVPPAQSAVPAAGPTSTTGTLAPALPLAGRTIAIDPGHNGKNGVHASEINQPVPAGGFTKACDTTGTETDFGYTESAYNLDVSLALAADLRRLGAGVVLTRTTDDGWGPCIDQRAAIGNQAHADAAVSIHADGGPAAGRGFEVIQPGLVPGYTAPIVGPSHQLALALRDSFTARTSMPQANYIGSSGLDTRTDLGGLNLSKVPKVLIECGNMRNATDAALLTDPGFRQSAAAALASGIETYLTSGPPH
ncbi:MAG TPA: N-acetylmuramoyl-L-alanine amidase [Acidimicrobiales bacterium]|nr:N-acetylmuramoyl-L-alanine amidase [Acidimicrobiales bacterium]